MGVKVKNIWSAALPAGRFSRVTINPGQTGLLNEGAEDELYIQEWLRKGRLEIVEDDEAPTADGKLSPIEKPEYLITGEKTETGVVAIAPETPEEIEEVRGDPVKTTVTKVGNASLTTIVGEDVKPEIRAGDPMQTAVATRKNVTVIVGDEEPDFFDEEATPRVTPENIMGQLKQLKSWRKQVQYIEAEVNDAEVLKAVAANSKKGGVVQRAAQDKMDSLTNNA